MKLGSTKKTLYHFHSLARVLIVPAVLVLLNILFTPFNLRWDLTGGKEYTLGEATRRTLAELKNPITLEVFFSRELPQDLIRVRQDVRDLIGEYQRLGRGMVLVEEGDPSGNPEAATEARELGIPELQFGRTGLKKLEISAGYAGVAVRYQDQSAPAILDAASSRNLEYDLTLAIKRLTRERPPRLGITADHGEQLDPDLRQRIDQEYQVATVSFTDGKLNPTDLDGLLIFGPTDAFSPAELFAIDQFVMRGGKLLVFQDGVNVDQRTLTGEANPVNVNQLLSAYGITINTDVVADPLVAETLAFRLGERPILLEYAAWPKFIQPPGRPWVGINPEHPITAYLSSITMPWPSSLTLQAPADGENRQVTALIASSPRAFTLPAQSSPVFLAPDALQPSGAAGQQVVAALAQGALKSGFAGTTLPEGMTVPEEEIRSTATGGAVLVVGSTRVFGPDFRTPVSENLVLLGNSLDALLQDASLIAIRSRAASRRPLKPLTEPQAAAIRYGTIAAGAALVVVSGLAAMLLRRLSTKRAVAKYSVMS